MIIYQIHECSGEYEYYRDYIVGSYLDKEKAIARMEELQHIEVGRQAQSEYCSACPICDTVTMAEDFDTAVKMCSMYCQNAKITEDVYGYDCVNYCSSWDEATYEIKEVEVIE